MEDMKQAHIFFNGKVQGVGFRYTTKAFASELKLTGWVKNLDDGRVEVLVEGEEENINKLCKLLEVQFEGFIRNKDIKLKNTKGYFNDFQIAF